MIAFFNVLKLKSSAIYQTLPTVKVCITRASEMARKKLLSGPTVLLVQLCDLHYEGANLLIRIYTISVDQ